MNFLLPLGASPRRRLFVLLLSIFGCCGLYYCYRRFFPYYQRVRSELAMVAKLLASTGGPRSLSADSPVALRYSHNLRVCRVTVEKFCQELRDRLKGEFPLEKMRAALGRQAPAENWENFIVSGISRSLMANYGRAFLSCFVSVALALIGRFVSADESSAVGKSLKTPKEGVERAHRKFFAMSKYLIDNGVAALERFVVSSVEEEFSCFPLSLQQEISRDSFKQKITKIQEKIKNKIIGQNENTEETPWLQAIFPGPAFIDREMQENRASGNDAERFSALCGESLTIFSAKSFRGVLKEEFDRGNEELFSWMLIQWPSSESSVPFVTAAVKFMKAFDHFLAEGEKSDGGGESIKQQDSKLKRLTGIIYFPIDDLGRSKGIFGESSKAPQQLNDPPLGGPPDLRALMASLASVGIPGI